MFVSQRINPGTAASGQINNPLLRDAGLNERDIQVLGWGLRLEGFSGAEGKDSGKDQQRNCDVEHPLSRTLRSAKHDRRSTQEGNRKPRSQEGNSVDASKRGDLNHRQHSVLRGGAEKGPEES
jgi:hypothetical protein